MEDPIADGLMDGRYQSGDSLVLTQQENRLCIECVKHAELT